MVNLSTELISEMGVQKKKINDMITTARFAKLPTKYVMGILFVVYVSNVYNKLYQTCEIKITKVCIKELGQIGQKPIQKSEV